VPAGPAKGRRRQRTRRSLPRAQLRLGGAPAAEALPRGDAEDADRSGRPRPSGAVPAVDAGMRREAEAPATGQRSIEVAAAAPRRTLTVRLRQEDFLRLRALTEARADDLERFPVRWGLRPFRHPVALGNDIGCGRLRRRGGTAGAEDSEDSGLDEALVCRALPLPPRNLPRLPANEDAADVPASGRRALVARSSCARSSCGSRFIRMGVSLRGDGLRRRWPALHPAHCLHDAENARADQHDQQGRQDEDDHRHG
jgi:hypothetical protein